MVCSIRNYFAANKEHFLQFSPVQELVHLKSEELIGRKDFFPLQTYKSLAEEADIDLKSEKKWKPRTVHSDIYIVLPTDTVQDF